MKGIYDILKECGVNVPDEAKESFEKELNANYKSVAEVTKKDATITELRGQLKTATDGLKAFDGVNVDDLKGQITKLTADLDQKDRDWQKKLMGIEFDHKIDDAITKARGKNAKAIKALMDIAALEVSTNRDADIAAAIESVKKDNDYLFDDDKAPGKYAQRAGTSGADAGKSMYDDPDIASFLRAAGITKNEE